MKYEIDWRDIKTILVHHQHTIPQIGKTGWVIGKTLSLHTVTVLFILFCCDEKSQQANVNTSSKQNRMGIRRPTFCKQFVTKLAVTKSYPIKDMDKLFLLIPIKFKWVKLLAWYGL